MIVIIFKIWVYLWNLFVDIFTFFPDCNVRKYNFRILGIFFELLTISFAWFSRFVWFAKSFISPRTIRQSGLLFTNWSMFYRIAALVPLGKLFTFTLWFLDIPFSCIPFSIESPVMTTLLFSSIVLSYIHIWFFWGFIVIYHFSWDFFEFNDNNCFVRLHLLILVHSLKMKLSFEMLTINPDESFVISLALFPAIIVSSSKLQSLLWTSNWIFLKLFISFSILPWFTLVPSKSISSNIIFLINKFLFELLEISCVSGTRTLSGSSGIRYVLNTPLPLSCYIMSITILSKMCWRSS